MLISPLASQKHSSNKALDQRTKAQGTTSLRMEQNVELTLRISDRMRVIDQSVIVHAGTAAELVTDGEIEERYCAV